MWQPVTKIFSTLSFLKLLNLTPILRCIFILNIFIFLDNFAIIYKAVCLGKSMPFVCHLLMNWFKYLLLYVQLYTFTYISRLWVVISKWLYVLINDNYFVFRKRHEYWINLTFDIKKQFSRSAKSNCARKNNTTLHSNPAVVNYICIASLWLVHNNWFNLFILFDDLLLLSLNNDFIIQLKAKMMMATKIYVYMAKWG